MTGLATEVATLDAVAQANLVRSGQVTATELVRGAIDRIEALNPTLNAVITPTFDSALAAAATVPATGPLSGVPFLVKDLVVEIAGVPFHEGSRFLSDHVSTYDSEIVRRWRRAGLVILGKTNCPEFGMVPATEPLSAGATRNPWDVGRSTSGSSGGSAAAVASGMVPIAHGNDAGGSLRYPASACGLFGLKPTRARNPLGPEYGDAIAGWACEHALTRTVRDSAVLLDATAGPDVGDPYPAPTPARPFAVEVGAHPGRLRIAYTSRTPEGVAAASGLRRRAGLCGRAADRPGARGRRGRPARVDAGRRSVDRDGVPGDDRLDRPVLGGSARPRARPTASWSRSPAPTWSGAERSPGDGSCRPSRPVSGSVGRSRGSSPGSTRG